jgi:heme-degrading monooxygenase HmoA
MIIRTWRGRAPSAKADAYPRHFRTTLTPHLQEVRGFLGAQLLQRRIGESVEFLVLTRWQSMAAIQGFAGEEIARAVVEPAAAAALSDFDATVAHYEVICDA